MWLAIDCGNSRIKWTLLADGQPLDSNAVHACAISDSDSNSDSNRRNDVLLNTQLNTQLKKAAQLAKSTWISFVGAAATKTRLLQMLAECRQVRFVRSMASGGGVINQYHRPSTLGSDRWLSLVAAAALQRDTIIINSGTAATVDALRADGVFVGGIILPGVLLMQQQISTRANLPPPHRILQSSSQASSRISSKISSLEKTPPLSTQDGMQKGAVLAIAGAAALLRKQLLPKAQYIISGGDAQHVLPHLPKSTTHIPNMPLHGLVRLRALSKTSGKTSSKISGKVLS